MTYIKNKIVRNDQKINNTDSKNNARKNIIHSLCRENYLLHKIRLYENNSSECLKDYNQSCLDFYLSILNKALDYISNKLSRNENNWKWKNLIKKSFAHKPFSMIPLLNVLSHRVIETEVKSFAAYFYYN